MHLVDLSVCSDQISCEKRKITDDGFTLPFIGTNVWLGINTCVFFNKSTSLKTKSFHSQNGH